MSRSAPQVKLKKFPINSVIKCIAGEDLVLEWTTKEKGLQFDLWTDMETGMFHEIAANVSQETAYDTVLQTTTTGSFTIYFRYFDKKKKTFVKNGQWLEVHIDPEWVLDAVVYNVFLRTYGAKSTGKPGDGGTFQDVITHMKDFVKMGVNVIYLNPFHQIGDLYRKYNASNHLPYYLQPGSPYSIKDPKSIDPEVAFPPTDEKMLLSDPQKQFRKLVDAAHKNGIRIIMDLVFNHTAHDFVLQRVYPEWFLYKEHIDSESDPYMYPEEVHNGKPWGDPAHTVSPYDYGQFSWTDTAQLNWEYKLPPAPNDPPKNTKKQEMYEYFKSIPKYWIKEFGVDGFRCDVAYRIPPDFWKQCIEEARQVARDSYPENGSIDGEVLFIAESRQDDIKLLFESGFSYVYGDYSNKIFKPLHLKGYLDYMYNIKESYFPPGSKWFIFPECHDFHRTTSKLVPGHIVNDDSTDYTEKREAAIRGNASRWILTACLPGMPMVFTGFEKVEWAPVDHVSYSKINWESDVDLNNLIAKVNRIRHSHLALQKGDYRYIESNQGLNETTQLFTFARFSNTEVIIIAVNMDIVNPCKHATVFLPKLNQFNPEKPYILKDLLTDQIYYRKSPELIVDLKPGHCHIFLVEQNWGV